MKVCKRCSKEHNIHNFRKHLGFSDGLDSICKSCRKIDDVKYREKHKNYQKEYRKLNKEILSRQNKEYREINKEQLKAKRQTSEHKTQRKFWRQNSRDKARETQRKYNDKPEIRERRRKRDRERNKTPDRQLKRRYYSSQRKRRVKRATPEWLTKSTKTEIKSFYDIAYDLIQQTGDDHHVDHIIPLSGIHVCGLNVPWNLQVLKCADNLKKSNKFDGTYNNEGWRNE